MSIYEVIVMVVSLVVCGLGSAWLIYDMNQQIKNYDEIMNENNKEDK